MNDPETFSPGASRREFLQESGAAVTAVALTSLAAEDAGAAALQPAGAAGIGPAATKLTLNVNGHDMTDRHRAARHAARCPAQLSRCHRLQARLRSRHLRRLHRPARRQADLFLHHARPGSTGQEDPDGRESVSTSGKLDAVPAAFVRADAQQCGFCTPGFVVAMQAAFEKTRKATPAEIEEALPGNICRCGTYEQMRDAIDALCNQKA